ncbi:hypothetical protein LTR49_028043 [Elasticomyces elasticus]|nr:hypothetical protein LTR49_028043 [Elasticomyces elasticus]
MAKIFSGSAREQDRQGPNRSVESIQRGEQAEKILAEGKAVVKAARARRKIEASISRYDANPWLHSTQWPQHLAGFRRERLLAAVSVERIDEGDSEGHGESCSGRGDSSGSNSSADSDDDDEEDLLEACMATRRLIRTAFATCKPHIVGRVALEFVNRRETGAPNNEKPFYAEQQVKTVKKYSEHWVKILRYIWRTTKWKRRPKYRLTDAQKKRLERVKIAAANSRVDSMQGSKEARAEAKVGLQEECLMFWISMFNHELRDREYDSAIMSGLAVLASDTQSGGWMPATNYPPRRQKEIRRRIVEEGMTEEEADNAVEGTVEGVQVMVKRFMTLVQFDGIISPMDRIMHQKTYGMKIRFNTKAEGRVAWQDEDRIKIDKISFTMGDIRTVVHGLNESVRERLVHDLMFINAARSPALDLRQIYDNEAEMSEDYSFLDDVRNKFEVDGNHWMWKRMFRERAIEKQFVIGGMDEARERSDIKWDGRGIERYMRVVVRFKEELMALVHLTAGAPARGTELLTVRHRNGVEAKYQRGLFVEHGMVVFVTGYHKGFNASQSVKIIHRYVPREVGELVVYYLWLVEPFVRQLLIMAREQAEFGTHLRLPKPDEEWEEDEEADDVEGEEGDEQGREVTEREVEGEAWSEDEAGQGTIQQRKEMQPLNPDGFWDTDKVRKILYRETESRIGVRIGVGVWRQVYPAIHREFTRDKNVMATLSSIYDGQRHKGGDENKGDAGGMAAAKQAGHGPRMEEMIYGLLLTESPFTTKSEQSAFRAVSVEWHQFLHFKSAWEEGMMDPSTRRGIRMEQEASELKRWQEIRRMNVQDQLERVVGRDAAFRGKQKEGLEAIVARQMRVLIIIRTGEGKSLCFMLPAAASKGGVTIVVVPLTALRQDMRKRCDKAGIVCREWDGKRPAHNAQIVLVTPESAVTKAFSRFITEKQQMHQLERIVIDECHTVLEVTDTFRPQVRQLCEMAEKETQLVFLTATLPPTAEEYFFEAMGVEREEVEIVRDVTTRGNIAYNVVAYEKQEEEEAVRRLVEVKKEQYPSPQQVVVYCRTREQTERLAGVLGCMYYHGKMTVEQKGVVMEELKSGRGHVFTSTNALGLGIDVPSIRAVIHVGAREQMTQYVQESGRAGRDGLASEAIVMQAFRVGKDGRQRWDAVRGLERMMEVYLEGSQCRRVLIDRCMDGREDRVGCEEGEQMCDVYGDEEEAGKE